MKAHFSLTCPHCQKVYHLGADARAWYDEHVTHCHIRPAGHWLGRLAHWCDRLAGLTADPVCWIGRVFIELRGADGGLRAVRLGHNLVVDTGRAAAIDRLQGTSVGVSDYQAVGTGTNAAAAGDTTLQTEIGTRVQGTLSQPTAYTDRLVSTFAAGNGTGALTETGRFTAISSGVLFARQVFSVVNKAAGDSLQITHDITD